MRRAAVTLVVVACIFRIPSAAGRTWTSATSAHFTVVADDGAKTARNIAWQFEQVRAAIHAFWPWARTDLDRPFFVLAARDESSMKALAPLYWEERGRVHPGSVSVTGVDRHYVALRSDVKADPKQGSINPYLNAYWAYTTIVLHNGLRRDLPLWFSRGLANFMSNTVVRESQLQVGRPLPWYLERLQTRGRLSLRELFTVDRTSPWYTQEERLQQFDAESWAFVHYLMLGDSGAHRKHLESFMTAIAQGQSAAGAADAAFGNIDMIESAFKGYFTRPIFQFMVFDVDVTIKEDAFDARTLSAADAASTQASWQVAMKRPIEARADIAEAKKADPKLAAPHDAEGMLLEVENQREEAKAAYATAMELGSTNAAVYYRWAKLTWGQQGSPAMLGPVEAALEKATKLNDRRADAFVLWAVLKAQTNHADQGLPLALQAVKLDPGDSYTRTTLGQILLMLQRKDEARAQATAALELARSDADKRAAQQLLDRVK